MGHQTASALSKKLGTQVEVGKVDIGLLNRVIIDDFELYDQQDKKMLSATRLSAKVDIPSLLKGKVSVSSAQLFGMKANLYRETAEAPFNFQFVIDSLSSKEQKEKKPLDLNINSLIIRNGAVNYDQLDAPVSPGRLSPQHLHLTGLTGHLMLYQLTDKLIDLKVKKLAFKESSGLDLRKLSLNLKGTTQSTRLSDLHIELPNSLLKADTLEATYQMAEGKLQKESLQFRGRINQMSVLPADLSFLQPSLSEIQERVEMTSQFTGTHNSITISNLNLSSANNVTLAANGSVRNLDSAPEWFCRVGELHVKSTALQRLSQNTGLNLSIPPQVLQLGDIEYRGELGGTRQEYALKGTLQTDLGNTDLSLGLQGQHFSGHADTDGLDIGAILQDDRLGIIATTLDVDGHLPLGREMSLLAKGKISRLDLNGHTYQNIDIDGFYDKETFNGTIGIDDPNGQIGIEGLLNLTPGALSADISASARHFNPEALGLTSDFKNHEFDFNLKANMSGENLKDLQGIIDLEDFHMQSPEKNYQLARLHIDADQRSSQKHIDVDSDFGHINLQGRYQLEDITAGIVRIVKSKLPTLPLLPPSEKRTANDYYLTADIDRSDWLRQLTGIDLDINAPLHIDGHVDESAEAINLICQAPSITYKGSDYRDVEITMDTRQDTLYTNASVIKMQDEGRRLDLALESRAAGNELDADLHFDNHGGKQKLRGMLSATADFYSDSHYRETAHVKMNSSQIFLNGTPWEVVPSELQLSKGNIVIDKFMIRNGDQHVRVVGSLTDSPNDTIHVDLNQLDAEFLSNILHVRGIDFGGYITGKAYLTSVTDTPEASADLQIEGFKFVDGLLGDMAIQANWNAKENRINIDGHADDDGQGFTDVNGYVSLSPGEINLDIQTDRTPLRFLHRFCSSFMRDIQARATGQLRLFGPLSDINLEGRVVANGDISLSALNTTYTLRNDTVTLVPDHIIFDTDSVFDRDGHYALVNGSVDHEHLSNFTFDIGVHANNLLSYDFKEFGDDTFCGTVYATGDCHIKGISGEVTIDVEATPERNTVFYYNAASPDALNSQDFIVWKDITPEAIDYSDLPSASKDAPAHLFLDQEESEDDTDDIASDLRMNFRINANPDATLRLLMDAESGDYIALNGSGTLRASYFNKGAFQLFGNYVVDHGIYKLTIQNVIKKDFQFQQGGTISFGGNPYDAALDLKAQYVVNGVPLSDLNIGRSFSTNNIRVNCIMNINGTPNQPTVDFDMEMPTVNSDAQQMVRSLINSEEELNQQVIYLLAIGRFYNQNASAMNEEGQSQTSLAMQSLLSGTISQQINSVLSNVIKNNNWNFGANISTGDEGFNNAEYEGLLSGRLLNNRLLINGQFGYRDNPNATTSFIGDFDIRYLLYPNGNLAVKVYNQTNDRYFVKNSLNTQGVGLIMKKDFNGWRELFGIHRKKKKNSK